MCEDFKITGMLLGDQTGYKKLLCFLREWDNSVREKHWTDKN